MSSPAAIILMVTPSLNPDGTKAYGERGQLFNGRINDRLIVKRSATPFCNAACVLLAEGVRPTSPYVMRHQGGGHGFHRPSTRSSALFRDANTSTA
jgi:hypothetical protein